MSNIFSFLDTHHPFSCGKHGPQLVKIVQIVEVSIFSKYALHNLRKRCILFAETFPKRFQEDPFPSLRIPNI